MFPTPFRRIPQVLYENRYCNQDEFDFIICGGINKSNYVTTNEVIKLKGPKLQTTVKMSPMLRNKDSSKTAVIGSDIYVLGGYNQNDMWTSFFETYSAKKKVWKELKQNPSILKHYSVCSFMKSIYLVGGFYSDYPLGCDIIYDEYYTDDCYKYDIKDNKWYPVASLQTERSNLACTVFEGKIVVTGGKKMIHSRYYTYSKPLKSVECYDHYENKWTFLCDINEPKSCHSSFSMGNKMFVIDGSHPKNCEVYDNVSRKFTIFYFNPSIARLPKIRAFCVNDMIYVFDFDLNMYAYNMSENKLTFNSSVFEGSLKRAALERCPRF